MVLPDVLQLGTSVTTTEVPPNSEALPVMTTPVVEIVAALIFPAAAGALIPEIFTAPAFCEFSVIAVLVELAASNNSDTFARIV